MVVDRRRVVVRYPPAKLTTPLDNPDPHTRMGGASCETHQGHEQQLMGIAEFIIGRAFTRPVGSTILRAESESRQNPIRHSEACDATRAGLVFTHKGMGQRVSALPCFV
jgi:hypothetical protein